MLSFLQPSTPPCGKQRKKILNETLLLSTCRRMEFNPVGAHAAVGVGGGVGGGVGAGGSVPIIVLVLVFVVVYRW